MEATNTNADPGRGSASNHEHINRSTALENALDLARRGHPIIALWGIGDDLACLCGKPCGRDAGKHPIFRGGQHTSSTDPKIIEGWFCDYPGMNYGIDLAPSGLMAFDIDHKDGPEAALVKLRTAELALDCPLPKTVAWVTGSGNFARVYKRPAHAIRGVLYEITLRGNNYVVGPGCRHRSGGTYRYEVGHSPSDVEVAEMPLAWSEATRRAARTTRPPRPARAVGEVEIPDDVEIPDAEDEPEWLRRIPEAERERRQAEHVAAEKPEVQGESPQGLMYNIARTAALRSGVRRQEVTLAVLCAYGARCVPPYPDDKITRTVENAYKADAPRWGQAFEPEWWKTTAPEPEPGSFEHDLEVALTDVRAKLGSGEDSLHQRKPLFIDALEILSTDYGPTPWLVCGVITRGGVALIGADSKRGKKSWFSIEGAIAVATGTAVAGEFPTDGIGRSAIFCAEDHARAVKNRTRALLAGRGRKLEPGRLSICPKGEHLDLAREDDIAWVVASARRLGQLDLLVFDPFRDCHSAEENDSTEMARVMRHLHVVAELLGTTVLVNHHVVKDHKADSGGGANIRGSSAIKASLDTIIAMDPRGDTDNVTTWSLVADITVKSARSAGLVDLVLEVRDDAGGEAEWAQWRRAGHKVSMTAEDRAAADLARDAATILACICESEVLRKPRVSKTTWQTSKPGGVPEKPRARDAMSWLVREAKVREEDRKIAATDAEVLNYCQRVRAAPGTTPDLLDAVEAWSTKYARRQEVQANWRRSAEERRGVIFPPLHAVGAVRGTG